jgi:hypothetical protein
MDMAATIEKSRNLLTLCVDFIVDRLSMEYQLNPEGEALASFLVIKF